MTDRTTRDAKNASEGELLRNQLLDVVVETRGRWSLLQDDIESRVPMPEFDQMVVDALVAAGLVVPAGLRAHALDILDTVDSLELLDLPEMRRARYGRIKLAAKALRDALELRETP